jgi:hypothetical protein
MAKHRGREGGRKEGRKEGWMDGWKIQDEKIREKSGGNFTYALVRRPPETPR